mmetsp:Transcript_30120/g.85985  ORF Transcript_30120/g.85985 Transcript_30120/m.85985 type:complete len:218 (-) Transcript_30120:126-779(-)
MVAHAAGRREPHERPGCLQGSARRGRRPCGAPRRGRRGGRLADERGHWYRVVLCGRRRLAVAHSGPPQEGREHELRRLRQAHGPDHRGPARPGGDGALAHRGPRRREPRRRVRLHRIRGGRPAWAPGGGEDLGRGRRRRRGNRRHKAPCGRRGLGDPAGGDRHRQGVGKDLEERHLPRDVAGLHGRLQERGRAPHQQQRPKVGAPADELEAAERRSH